MSDRAPYVHPLCINNPPDDPAWHDDCDDRDCRCVCHFVPAAVAGRDTGAGTR
jgi:hypothetical protein